MNTKSMNSKLRKDCPMRHENGNCLPCGGFCTSVNDPICKAMHNAYNEGYSRGSLVTYLDEIRKIEDEKMALLRQIHQSVLDGSAFINANSQHGERQATNCG